VKKFLATLFLVAAIGSAVAAGGASASVTPPGCHSYGILHTGC
jgi:hypothetical protein